MAPGAPPPSPAGPAPAGGPRREPRRRIPAGLASLGLVLCGGLLLSGCQQRPSAESQRIDELEFKLQQLEERLNKVAAEKANGADRTGKPPAGVIKSLTLRSGSADDRLRIYWADGSTTDLPCTKEQGTLACG